MNPAVPKAKLENVAAVAHKFEPGSGYRSPVARINKCVGGRRDFASRPHGARSSIAADSNPPRSKAASFVPSLPQATRKDAHQLDARPAKSCLLRQTKCQQRRKPKPLLTSSKSS